MIAAWHASPRFGARSLVATRGRPDAGGDLIGNDESWISCSRDQPRIRQAKRSPFCLVQRTAEPTDSVPGPSHLNSTRTSAIVTVLRARYCGHSPIIVPVTRRSSGRENSRGKVHNVVTESSPFHSGRNWIFKARKGSKRLQVVGWAGRGGGVRRSLRPFGREACRAGLLWSW